MKKSKRPTDAASADTSLNSLRSALVVGEFTLPTREEELTDDDIALFGQGTPADFASIKLAAESRATVSVSSDENTVVQESLAMAARNGQQISEGVWSRMQADRKRAESDDSSND